MGDAPSALKLILPEQKLSDGHTEEHIAAINAEMERYLERDLFRALPDSPSSMWAAAEQRRTAPGHRGADRPGGLRL